MYDFLIVGAGLFGAVCSYELTKRGKKCLVIDKRDHIGGNCYTENYKGITVHKYGPHIFHTDDKFVWEYVNHFAEFQPFKNEPIAVYKNQCYNLPFNMNTFCKVFGVVTPYEAERKIKEDKIFTGTPSNVEEKAVSMVGNTIYKMFVKGYTEKQWGEECKFLPPDIISRIPLRFTFDNNYFNDKFQGVPVDGYTPIFYKLLEGSTLMLKTNFSKEYENKANTVIYTGKIDEYYDYCFGKLPYRSLMFSEKIFDDVNNYQGAAVVNYTEKKIPYTRIVEHKHFDKKSKGLNHTVITYEYPVFHNDYNEPYYPIPTKDNIALYERYRAISDNKSNIIFAGRTGEYKYYDMDDTVLQAVRLIEKITEGK